MAPKKVARSEAASSPDQLADKRAAKALTADHFKGASGEDDLLHRLLAARSALEELRSALGFKLEKGFFEELAHRMLINHPNGEVQALAATNLAEAVRVAATDASAAAAASALPLKATAVVDVTQLWIATILRLRNKPSPALLDCIRHLIESLATSRVLAAVVAAEAITDDRVTSLFDTLLSFSPPDADDSYIGAVATLLSDCIAAKKTVTDSQLRLLFLAVAQRSVSPTMYRVVVAVLRRQEDTLQNVVSDFVIGAFTDAVENLHRIDVEGDAESTERRNAVKRISSVAGLVGECTKISSILAHMLLPSFIKLLESMDGNEARAAIVHGAGQAFLAVPSLVKDFLPSYFMLVKSMSDPKPAVRMQSLLFASEMLLSNPSVEAYWAQLGEAINARVLDHDEPIRKAALNSVCALAERALGRIPKAMLSSVGTRCADRRPAVRAHAIERLAALYRSLRHGANGDKLAWVPKTILQSVHVDGNVPIVEAALTDLLPNPARTEAAAAAAGKAKKGSAKVPTIAVFDFELFDEAQPSAASTSSGSNITFAQAFILLCDDVLQTAREDADGIFATLRTFFEKRTQLRAAVKRLMELRTEIRVAKDKEAEIKKAHLQRLAAFLAARTHARPENWVQLGVMKDEKAVKALIALASDDCEDLGAAAMAACKIIVANGQKDGMAAFFEKQVLPRIAFPVSKAHVDEIVKTIGEARTRGAGAATAAKLLPASHALSLVAQSAPHLVARSLASVMNFVIVDSQSPTSETQEVALTLLLRVLVSSFTLRQNAEPPADVKAVDAVSALGRLCQSSHTPSLAKWSAKALTNIYGKGFAQLIPLIVQRIATATTGDAAAYTAELPGLIKSIQVFAAECPPKAFPVALETEALDHIKHILLAATRTKGKGDTVEVSSSTRGVRLSNPKSHFHVLVDCCAKAINAFVTRHRENGSVRGPLVKDAAAAYFESYVATKEVGTSTLGGTLKRLALTKQMIKLLKYPQDLPLAEQVRLTTYVSAEHNAFNRAEVQLRLSGIVQKERPDMRVFGTLCMTALSERSKAGYNFLKHQIQLATDKLRALQGDTVDLSKPESLSLCPEYCIPFVVMALAHHGFYNNENENHFTGFQRVWHIIFEELTRFGVHKVSFLQDLLRKLRGFDDSLAPEHARTRVMCDLGLKVLLASLAQRSVGVDALKPYPGCVLLPSYFVKPTDDKLHPVDKVYLAEDVIITPQAVFRAPTRAREDGDDGEGDDEDDERVAPQVDDDEYARDPLALTPQAKGRSQPGRGKSRRESTPPRGGDENAPPLTSPGAASGAKSRSRAATTPSKAHHDEDDEDDTVAQINAVVDEYLRDMTLQEIQALQWRQLKTKISETLHIEVTADLKEAVIKAVVEVQNRKSSTTTTAAKRR